MCDPLRPFALRGVRHRRAPTGGALCFLCVLCAFALTLCAFALTLCAFALTLCVNVLCVSGVDHAIAMYR